MPHFVIDCSEEVLTLKSPENLMETVYKTAVASSLFDPEDIKVRIQPFHQYLVGGERTKFIHIFSNIMEGRTTEQKANLSKAIITELKNLFPTVPIISINIRDFEKATYCNKNLV